MLVLLHYYLIEVPDWCSVNHPSKPLTLTTSIYGSFKKRRFEAECLGSLFWKRMAGHGERSDDEYQTHYCGVYIELGCLFKHAGIEPRAAE